MADEVKSAYVPHLNETPEELVVRATDPLEPVTQEAALDGILYVLAGIACSLRILASAIQPVEPDTPGGCLRAHLKTDVEVAG